MGKKLLIFGIGMFCETLISTLSAEQRRVPDVYTVDSKYCNRDMYCGKPLIPFEEIESYCNPEEYEFITAVGYAKLNHVRLEKSSVLRNKGYSSLSFVSKYARISPDIEIPEGSIILENVVIHPFVTLGKDNIILPNNYIGHHSTIGNACYFGPNACICGKVHIGDCCFVGANATVRDFVTVGSSCIIGAGSVLMRNLSAGCLCNVGESTVISDKAASIDLTNPNIMRSNNKN